jgi:hypothetical protein
LKPEVKGAGGSFGEDEAEGIVLMRYFTHPRGPITKDGEPTRLALSAHAWGEPVPKTDAAAKKLAARGRKLLERYQAAKGAGAGSD